jgi:hypothetical protein
MKEIDIQILTCLHVFSSLNAEERREGVLERRLFICMCTSVAPEGLNGYWSYSTFKNSSNIDQCLVDKKKAILKSMSPLYGAQNTKWLFYRKWF